MLYLVIIISIVAVFLLTRLFALKKEVKKISKQLQIYNNRKTDKKIDMALINKDIENLGLEINKLIDLYVTENRKRVRFENEQKQAVANMSHDLRTPLTSILGYIQMAESADGPEDEKKELLSIAKSRAKRLETLLNDFFELSVIESTDHHLKSERINLRSITIDVLMSFYDRFNENNMEPTIHIPENDIFINSDEAAVIRVIENLISNCLNHSDGNINISLEEKDSTARLMVKNDTHSLTEKDVEHISDRFYMADQSRSGKSTGVGLSIVKSFMDKMNGSLTGHLKDGQLSIVCEWKTYTKK
ncbi:two-component sensor histidine kinase [Virgibacillus profundi]|uniref:histidine kinase n=1 Tax=Virgibacillus profundi TaxID=2024555 RepID=A0A2A2I989_9BACI|nr:HAMP domain-containing sensor histidine kinase [Virgibacillus profundi]PAV28289.1 two-component sensor histidine kinase [Virgibacillus profundi]PXY52593.1 sensor histidine kinase [Virgibacillus profundi]